MKKNLILVMALICFSGCSEAKREKITCTKDETLIGATSTMTVTYTLYKHRMDAIDFTFYIKADSKMQASVLNELDSVKNNYYNEYGINSEIIETSTGAKLVFSLNASESADYYTKVNGKPKEDAFYTKDSIIENGKKYGFTCKEG